jgi:integrase/recombinase XerD
MENASLIKEFYEFMKSNNSSERHIINNLKVIANFDKFFKSEKLLKDIKRQDILSFLDSKIKSSEIDPEKKWITTWNHYCNHLKFFFRWLYNDHIKSDNDNNGDRKSLQDWDTPAFVKIKLKKTKRISPYSQNEIWDKDELLTIIKYEPFKRNKAALALFWDLDARNHEITLLRIKNIRLREKYGEGEVPHEAKTGSGPILLTLSFPYVRDWLNEHPFKNELEARVICNLITGAPIKSDAMWTMMKQLQKRIKRLLEQGEIKNNEEKEKLEYLLKTKKWNPYCIRHSSITADSDYLPDYALKKKVRWSMNSKQGSRYIKKRMGNELKNKILEYNGISVEPLKIHKPAVSTCPRCQLVNTLENRYCSACSYPLSPEAYDQIKQDEERRFIEMEKKYTDKLTNIENMLDKLFLKVDLQKVT